MQRLSVRTILFVVVAFVLAFLAAYAMADSPRLQRFTRPSFAQQTTYTSPNVVTNPRLPRTWITHAVNWDAFSAVEYGDGYRIAAPESMNAENVFIRHERQKNVCKTTSFVSCVRTLEIAEHPVNRLPALRRSFAHIYEPQPKVQLARVQTTTRKGSQVIFRTWVGAPGGDAIKIEVEGPTDRWILLATLAHGLAEGLVVEQ